MGDEVTCRSWNYIRYLLILRFILLKLWHLVIFIFFKSKIGDGCNNSWRGASGVPRSKNSRFTKVGFFFFFTLLKCFWPLTWLKYPSIIDSWQIWLISIFWPLQILSFVILNCTNNYYFSCSFPCPWYQNVPLSLALSPRIINEVKQFKPDIIHASSPGIMVHLYFYLFNVSNP